MYTKVLLVVIILVLGAFFYLHTKNPGIVTFVVTSEYTYALPATSSSFSASSPASCQALNLLSPTPGEPL
ncbi:MAG: hypothetical protein HS130_03810 [Deltaproteobacteria bacterium]|nr:hypothetical protein [Deltaproteobacteria bacterium]